MNWREFLKPEWSKFILPIILLLTFTFFVYSFNNISKKLENLPCELLPLMKELDEARKNNNTEKITEIAEEQVKLQGKYNIKDLRLGFTQKNIFYRLILKIDPIFPAPCEILYEKKCKNYNSKESFECSLEVENYSPFKDLGIIEIQKEYKPLTIFDILLNILILLIEGYLVSCLIIWIYKKVKR